MRSGAALVLLAAWVAMGCGGDAATEDGAAADDPRVGAGAPAYSATTLDGDTVSLAGLRGSPVLLNVWATWCAPCRQEIPELQALHEAHADEGLRVVGVSVDSRAAIGNVREFVDEFGMTYDIWLDPDQTALSAFGGMGVPLTVLIGPSGTVRWQHLGVLEPNEPGLAAALEDAI